MKRGKRSREVRTEHFAFAANLIGDKDHQKAGLVSCWNYRYDTFLQVQNPGYIMFITLQTALFQLFTVVTAFLSCLGKQNETSGTAVIKVDGAHTKRCC